MATRIVTIERRFTTDELALKAKEMAAILQEIDSLEADKKASDAHYNALIKKKIAEGADMAKTVNKGFETQDVEADVLINTPEHGKKTYISIATGQPIKVADMLPDEFQTKLFDDDKRPDPASETPAENITITLPSDEDLRLFLNGMMAEPDTTIIPDRSHENKPKGGKRGRPPKAKPEAEAAAPVEPNESEEDFGGLGAPPPDVDPFEDDGADSRG